MNAVCFRMQPFRSLFEGGCPVVKSLHGAVLFQCVTGLEEILESPTGSLATYTMVPA